MLPVTLLALHLAAPANAVLITEWTAPMQQPLGRDLGPPAATVARQIAHALWQADANLHWALLRADSPDASPQISDAPDTALATPPQGPPVPLAKALLRADAFLQAQDPNAPHLIVLLARTPGSADPAGCAHEHARIDVHAALCQLHAQARVLHLRTAALPDAFLPETGARPTADANTAVAALRRAPEPLRSCAAVAAHAHPAWLPIPSTTVQVGQRDIFVPGGWMEPQAAATPLPSVCDAPTPAEWLAASTQPGFVPSRLPERLRADPPVVGTFVGRRPRLSPARGPTAQRCTACTHASNDLPALTVLAQTPLMPQQSTGGKPLAHLPFGTYALTQPAGNGDWRWSRIPATGDAGWLHTTWLRQQNPDATLHLPESAPSLAGFDQLTAPDAINLALQDSSSDNLHLLADAWDATHLAAGQAQASALRTLVHQRSPVQEHLTAVPEPTRQQLAAHLQALDGPPSDTTLCAAITSAWRAAPGLRITAATPAQTPRLQALLQDLRSMAFCGTRPHVNLAALQATTPAAQALLAAVAHAQGPCGWIWRHDACASAPALLAALAPIVAAWPAAPACLQQALDAMLFAELRDLTEAPQWCEDRAHTEATAGPLSALLRPMETLWDVDLWMHALQANWARASLAQDAASSP